MRGLTFDMRGLPKGAKRPLERPLDGGLGAWLNKATAECLTASSCRRALNVYSLVWPPDHHCDCLGKGYDLRAECGLIREPHVKDGDEDGQLSRRQGRLILRVALTAEMPKTDPSMARLTAEHLAYGIGHCGGRDGLELNFRRAHEFDVNDWHEGPNV